MPAQIFQSELIFDKINCPTLANPWVGSQTTECKQAETMPEHLLYSFPVPKEISAR